jgi:hydroxyethylthiazole kinase-like uncharacterized protein yjeF
MRASDRWAIEQQGVPALDLMERAGAGVARAVEHIAPDGPVTVVCGKGNNGGDGLVTARLLREAARDVTVVCIAPAGELSPDARENLERLPGEPPVMLDSLSRSAPEALAQRAARTQEGSAAGPAGPAAIVDALLGTGFEGAPRGPAADAIEAINANGAPVVSVDVPSGVDASTGTVSGVAVRAAATVTFHAPKPGLWINPGKSHAGEIETLDIGIPRGAPAAETAVGLIKPSILGEAPLRQPGSTKFTSGHVLVAGGSRDLSGAPRMAAHASMRTGAGYVTACVPASLQAIIATAAPPELMTRGLPDDEGALLGDGAGAVLELAARGGALVLGPGLGRSEGAGEFARELARSAELPLVLDADGLGAYAGRAGELAARRAATVLTPHAGELARLLEIEYEEVDRERLRHVRAVSEQTHAVVVLKGDDSLIAEPGGQVAVSPGGSPALATAGTGDVLSGVIAAFLAQGMDAFAAAAAGVWLHVLAGREAARRQGAPEGVIAGDVIAALPAVRRPNAGGEGAGRAQGAESRAAAAGGGRR